jgi:hypothetical protein
LLCDVRDHRVCPLRVAALISGVGHGGDPHPPQISASSVREPADHISDHPAGSHGVHHGKLVIAEWRSVLVYRLPLWVKGPGGDLVRGHTEDLARRRVSPEDRSVRVVMDYTEGERLEQRPVAFLRDRKPLRDRVLTTPVNDLGSDILQENEHASDASGMTWHWLKDQIQKHLLRLLAKLANPESGLVLVEGLTTPVNTRHKLDALARQLRQGLAQWAADQVAASDVPPILLVGELEHQVGPG